MRRVLKKGYAVQPTAKMAIQAAVCDWHVLIHKNLSRPIELAKERRRKVFAVRMMVEAVEVKVVRP
jgi:hypothetical protein